MRDDLRPNEAELQFLTLAYNRFYDIFDEVMDDSFWERESWYRFSRVKDGFAVYSELLNYEPLKWVLEDMRTSRPPMEAEIASELFRFIRNLIVHFPFFDTWDDVWVNRSVVNCFKEDQSIDRFLTKHSGTETVKYRFWEADKKTMTYLSINFPKQYEEGAKVHLKDILTEKEGVKFTFILMRRILDTQVLSAGEQESTMSI
ncbi:MAG: hypothetical protein A2Y72_06410 [Chloroflexi bacterium RBG_13_53_26]|nr:MAG: hypothetical protein A2Y72_06410 [Chloroflexi bacterium RBG_13_53_26]